MAEKMKDEYKYSKYIKFYKELKNKFESLNIIPFIDKENTENYYDKLNYNITNFGDFIENFIALINNSDNNPKITCLVGLIISLKNINTKIKYIDDNINIDDINSAIELNNVVQNINDNKRKDDRLDAVSSLLVQTDNANVPDDEKKTLQNLLKIAKKIHKIIKENKITNYKESSKIVGEDFKDIKNPSFGKLSNLLYRKIKNILDINCKDSLNSLKSSKSSISIAPPIPILNKNKKISTKFKSDPKSNIKKYLKTEICKLNITNKDYSNIIKQIIYLMTYEIIENSGTTDEYLKSLNKKNIEKIEKLQKIKNVKDINIAIHEINIFYEIINYIKNVIDSISNSRISKPDPTPIRNKTNEYKNIIEMYDIINRKNDKNKLDNINNNLRKIPTTTTITYTKNWKNNFQKRIREGLKESRIQDFIPEDFEHKYKNISKIINDIYKKIIKDYTKITKLQGLINADLIYKIYNMSNSRISIPIIIYNANTFENKSECNKNKTRHMKIEEGGIATIICNIFDKLSKDNLKELKSSSNKIIKELNKFKSPASPAAPASPDALLANIRNIINDMKTKYTDNDIIINIIYILYLGTENINKINFNDVEDIGFDKDFILIPIPTDKYNTDRLKKIYSNLYKLPYKLDEMKYRVNKYNNKYDTDEKTYMKGINSLLSIIIKNNMDKLNL